MHRCELSRRNGRQQVSHTVTHCYLEGSSDNVSFTKILESVATIDITWPLNFSVTLPYKYFKLGCTGKLQFGSWELKLYEVVLIFGEKKRDKGNKGDQTPRGFTAKDGNTLQNRSERHFSQSSDGLRLSPKYIETKEVKTDLRER